MRQLVLGLCILAAACSEAGGPTMPTASSSVTEATGAQVHATSSSPVEVSFVKWLHPTVGFPSFVGEAGGDGPGSFAATVLERTPFENGNIVDLRARYEYLADDGQRSFVTVIEGKQNAQTQSAVLNGSIVEGWLAGARVHVTFDIIRPCPEFGQSVCFRGIIRVLAGSAH